LVIFKKKSKTMMPRLSIIISALLFCAFLALGGDASAAASSTVVSTLPPAGEVVELTVKEGEGERMRKRKKKSEIDGRSTDVGKILNLLFLLFLSTHTTHQDDNFDALIRADTHTDWLVTVVVRSFFLSLCLIFLFTSRERK